MKSILQIFDKGLMQSRDIHNGTLLGYDRGAETCSCQALRADG
jgi:hypothetical protein